MRLPAIGHVVEKSTYLTGRRQPNQPQSVSSRFFTVFFKNRGLTATADLQQQLTAFLLLVGAVLLTTLCL